MASILRKFRAAQEKVNNPQQARKRIFNLNDQHNLEAHYERKKEELGRGTFAIVYRGVSHATGEEVAIKVISKNNIDTKVEALKSEVKILMNIKHEHIVNMLDVYEDDDFVYVVMQYMRGGELFDKIVKDYPNGYSEQRASQVVRDILRAVHYLHGVGIIHRDLKPENLLFSDSSENAVIKITDFGLAKIWSGDMLVRSACGSPNYVAPEVLLNEMQGYTFAVDLWSVGVITYVLLCGFCPFYDDNVAALFRAITQANFTFPSPFWDNISADAKDFVRRLLVVNPEVRMDAEQALCHDWIVKNTRDTVMPSISENMRRFKPERSRTMLFDEDDEEEGEEEED
eukprot:PhM_4_TR17473/c1_g1_i1/m.33060/K08794/CAMK1; calcium/calmodulin-dependent protein kinase I